MENQAFWNKNWAAWNSAQKPSKFAEKALKIIKIKDLHTVLDVGCGKGENSRLFAENGVHTTALDISSTALESVKRLHRERITTLCADIVSADLGREKYDAVFACLSLHYFDDCTTRKIVGKLYDALTPDGVLFARCKSTKDPLYGKGEPVGKDMFRLQYVRHFFSPEYMQDVLSAFPVVHIAETREDYFGDCAFTDAVAAKIDGGQN